MRGLHSLTPNNRANHPSMRPAGKVQPFRWFNFAGQKGEAPPGDVVRGERYVSPSPASRPSANPPAKSMQPLGTASNANSADPTVDLLSRAPRYGTVHVPAVRRCKGDFGASPPTVS